MSDLMRDYPLLYGLICIVTAVGLCWLMFRAIEIHDEERGRK